MPDPLFPLNAPQNPSQQPGQQKQEIGEVVYNVEFNDSVLSTKTWNNPRYDGCETKTQTLNKFTQGDITYGKKTAVQKYTRNIYVGEIITSCSGSDDPNLVPFPNFSYVSTTKYITVNDDDNINEVRYSNNIIDEKIGFYRSFLEDFAVGSNCRILLLNEGIVNSLEDKYNVYFADGRLKKTLFSKTITSENEDFGAGDSYFPSFTPSANNIGLMPYSINRDDLGDFSDIEIFNNSETSFYTSSNIITPISKSELDFFINDVTSNIQESTFNRFFITFTTGSNGLELIKNNSISRSHISTYEVQSWPSNNFVYTLDMSTKFIEADNDIGGLDGLRQVSYFISKLNDSIPSVLINLNKDEQLPNGLIPGQYVPNPFGGEIIFQQDFAQRVGPKFVIIPENLHPYVKENLNYFLIKAGLMEENNKLTINPKNRQLS